MASEVFQREEGDKRFTDLQAVSSLDEVDDKMGLLPLITPFIVKKETEIHEINKKNEELQNQLNSMDKDVIVLVEGKHDKVILENAWKALNPDHTANFVIQNYYDCYQIENVLKREDVFSNDPY